MIHALTACVNYADLLARSLDRWVDGLDSLTVVTTPDDSATIGLCRPYCVVHRTDAFTANGATFNKGAAMAEAFDAHFRGHDSWFLFFDADILPPADWRRTVDRAGLEPGKLYGCRRTQDGKPIAGDAPGVGYFQLFHATDPNARRVPIVETCWRHAGAYDSEFMHRWPGVEVLPLTVEHLGEPGQWWGRGNREAFDAMQAKRATTKPVYRNGSTYWTHEQCTLPSSAPARPASATSTPTLRG